MSIMIPILVGGGVAFVTVAHEGHAPAVPQPKQIPSVGGAHGMPLQAVIAGYTTNATVPHNPGHAPAPGKTPPPPHPSNSAPSDAAQGSSKVTTPAGNQPAGGAGGGGSTQAAIQNMIIMYLSSQLADYLKQHDAGEVAAGVAWLNDNISPSPGIDPAETNLDTIETKTAAALGKEPPLTVLGYQIPQPLATVAQAFLGTDLSTVIAASNVLAGAL